MWWALSHLRNVLDAFTTRDKSHVKHFTAWNLMKAQSWVVPSMILSKFWQKQEWASYNLATITADIGCRKKWELHGGLVKGKRQPHLLSTPIYMRSPFISSHVPPFQSIASNMIQHFCLGQFWVCRPFPCFFNLLIHAHSRIDSTWKLFIWHHSDKLFIQPLHWKDGLFYRPLAQHL